MTSSSTPSGPATEPHFLAVAPLAVTGLHTSFRRGRDTVDVVHDVSFALERGKTLMLLGESGSGKSVTARSILRLYGPNAVITGSVTMNGVQLLDLPEPSLRALRGRQIALVPQDPTGALDPLRKIGAQLTEVLRTHRIATTRRAGAERARELLAQVGIRDPKRVFDSFPHELSGGMRQRAVIAIAISCDPQVLIADEPTTALDVTVQAQILDLIGTLREATGMAVLMITHDIGVAADYGDQVGVMYRGRLIESGPAAATLRSPRHPYTRALLAAQPRPGVPRGTLPTVSGWDATQPAVTEDLAVVS